MALAAVPLLTVLLLILTGCAAPEKAKKLSLAESSARLRLFSASSVYINDEGGSDCCQNGVKTMKTKELEYDEVKTAVRERYGQIAENGGSCGCAPAGCGANRAAEVSKVVGYSEQEIAAAPEGANLDLGCGNPVAIASLKPGHTVVDLGSGAGFDVFLAARAVGPTGRVIGRRE